METSPNCWARASESKASSIRTSWISSPWMPAAWPLLRARGVPTAARFFACSARDIGADNRALPGQVEFMEVLGRNTGWLVAATALARRDPDDAPHLIYLPETRLPLAQLVDDVDRIYRRLGRCVVTVCEGQLDE